MIFSDKTIQDFLTKSAIRILPDFDPINIRPARIRLHLNNELLIPQKGQIVDLDANQDITLIRQPILTEGFILHPNEFVLGCTYEKIQVPRNVVAMLMEEAL